MKWIIEMLSCRICHAYIESQHIWWKGWILSYFSFNRNFRTHTRDYIVIYIAVTVRLTLPSVYGIKAFYVVEICDVLLKYVLEKTPFQKKDYWFLFENQQQNTDNIQLLQKKEQLFRCCPVHTLILRINKISE